MTNKEILKLRFYSDYLRKEISIEEYLKLLLIKLLQETEGFNGKKPFGNSAWIYDLAYCLCTNGIIKSQEIEDEEGCYEFDYKEFENKIIEIVRSM